MDMKFHWEQLSQTHEQLKAKRKGTGTVRLLSYQLTQAAVLFLIPQMQELGIPILIEKQEKEDFLVLQVDAANSTRIYLLETLCELVKDKFNINKPYNSTTDFEINDIIKMLKKTSA